MKKILMFLLVFTAIVNTSFGQKTSYKVGLIGFYNLENFYDTINDPFKDDEEFLPNSPRRYNSHIYWDKVDRLATVLSKVGTDITPDGLAIVGVAEIENDTVLTDLVNNVRLKPRGLKFVHYNSPDVRGVDVGLIYNPKYFTPLHSEPLFVKLPGGSKDSYFTRDVLYVKGVFNGDTINVFVNHWPSRSGGEERSMPARAAAAGVVKNKVDSLTAIDINTKIVIMGDLNDDPISPSLTKVLQTKGNEKEVKPGGLYNPWVDMYKKGLGTLAYQDSWGLFDQIIVSSGWLDKKQSGYFYQKQFIFNEPWLVQKTGKYRGYSKRTWDGITYNYGYSDHFSTYIMLLKTIPAN